MYKGYFPVWRKIENWGWYKDGNTMRVFLHLLMHANFKESNYLGHTIYPGEVVSGRKSLAVSLGLSEQQIRTALSHLKATNELTTKNCNKFSVITLINFRKYTISTSERPSEQPPSNQRVTTSKNVKNIKNDKNKEWFNTLWNKYPKKLGKTVAFKRFSNSVETEEDWVDINTALNNYLESKRVANGYIKNGDAWLNIWQDWVTFKEPVCKMCKGKGKYTSVTGYDIVCKCKEV